MNKAQEETVWFKDPANFITKDNFLIFFPTSDMNYVEQINAIVRFALYLTIILLLFHNNYKTFYILITVLMITYAMYIVEIKKKDEIRTKFENKGEVKSKSTGKVCKRPSKTNPFMNLLVSDYEKGNVDVEACDVQNEAIKEEMLEDFNSKLYRSTGDAFNKISNDRQFYTMPNTGLINNQGEFANWLYKRDNCKSGSAQHCWANVSETFLGKV